MGVEKVNENVVLEKEHVKKEKKSKQSWFSQPSRNVVGQFKQDKVDVAPSAGPSEVVPMEVVTETPLPPAPVPVSKPQVPMLQMDKLFSPALPAAPQFDGLYGMMPTALPAAPAPATFTAAVSRDGAFGIMPTPPPQLEVKPSPRGVVDSDFYYNPVNRRGSSKRTRAPEIPNLRLQSNDADVNASIRGRRRRHERKQEPVEEPVKGVKIGSPRPVIKKSPRVKELQRQLLNQTQGSDRSQGKLASSLRNHSRRSRGRRAVDFESESRGSQPHAVDFERQSNVSILVRQFSESAGDRNTATPRTLRTPRRGIKIANLTNRT